MGFRLEALSTLSVTRKLCATVLNKERRRLSSGEGVNKGVVPRAVRSRAKQLTVCDLNVVRPKWILTLDVQVSSEVWRSPVRPATWLKPQK